MVRRDRLEPRARGWSAVAAICGHRMLKTGQRRRKAATAAAAALLAPPGRFCRRGYCRGLRGFHLCRALESARPKAEEGLNIHRIQSAADAAIRDATGEHGFQAGRAISPGGSMGSPGVISPLGAGQLAPGTGDGERAEPAAGGDGQGDGRVKARHAEQKTNKANGAGRENSQSSRTLTVDHGAGPTEAVDRWSSVFFTSKKVRLQRSRREGGWGRSRADNSMRALQPARRRQGPANPWASLRVGEASNPGPVAPGRRERAL